MNVNFGASGILIRNGRVLLGKRNADDVALPNFWCSPGGGLEIGEIPQTCLIREFVEEVGMVVRPLDERPLIKI